MPIPREWPDARMSRLMGPNPSLEALLNGKVDRDNGLHYVIATGSTERRTVQDRFAEDINVRDWGAVGDGSKSDQWAFDLAYYAAKSRGGGRIIFPHSKDGNYLVNIEVLDDNIVVVGGGARGVRENVISGLAPADLSKPVVKVGNDTRVVDGFGMRDIAIFGYRNGTNCPSCLYFAGGAFNSDVSFCQFIGAERTLYFKAGLLYPSTLIGLSHCVIWGGPTSGIEMDDTRLGDPEAGFATGVKFSVCYLNGDNNSGKAIRVIKGKVNLSDFYMDAVSGKAIYLKGGGNLSCSNCDLEVESTTGVLVEVDFTGEIYQERAISRFIQGATVRMQGKVNWIDNGGTVQKTLRVIESLLNEPEIRKPYLLGPIVIGDVVNPEGIFQLDRDGLDIVLTRLDLSPPRLRLGENEAYLLFGRDNTAPGRLFVENLKSTTQPVTVEIGRSTSTTGDAAVVVFKGNGADDRNTYLSGKTNSYINAMAGAVGIGTNSPDPSARLDVASNASGLLPPRMTKAQRDAIASPAEGLMIHQLDSTPGMRQYVNGTWNLIALTPDP